MTRRTLLLALAVCLAAVLAAATWQWRSQRLDAPLTTAHAILALSPQAAEAQRRVHLPEAVVTSFDPEIRLVFVQDATAGVYIDSLATPATVRVGDRVAVEGVTSRGVHERSIANARLQVIGRADLPAPLVLPPSQYRAGVGDSQWVEVEGVLRASRRMMNRFTLEIVRDNVRAFVLVSDPVPAAVYVPGDRLRVRGVLGGGYNYKDRLVERRVFAPSLAHVTRLVSAAPVAPPATIARIRAERGRAEFEAPIRAEGVVDTYVPGASMVLRNGEETLAVRLGHVPAVEVGERVDVTGFPAVTAVRGLALEDATLVRVGQGQRTSPDPLWLTSLRAVRDLDPAADSVRMPVRVRGQVVYRDPDASEGPSLYVHDGTGAAFVYATGAAGRTKLGDLVEVVGETATTRSSVLSMPVPSRSPGTRRCRQVNPSRLTPSSPTGPTCGGQK